MNRLYAIKIKQSDGTYGNEIPINVLAQNVDWDSSHTLVDILGTVDTTISIQDQINNLVNTKATQVSVNTLETRVNNIIVNAGNDNTEIVDARIGADGTVYPTLGDAIRTQNSDLKSHLDTLDTEAFGWSEPQFEQGYWDAADGSAKAGAAWIRTIVNLPDDVAEINIDGSTNIVASVLAYENGTYKGYWNGTAWTKTYNASDLKQYYNIASLKTAYPTYKFRVAAHRTNGNTLSVSDAIYIHFSYVYQRVVTEAEKTICDDILINTENLVFGWEQGGLSEGTGGGYSTNYRIRTNAFSYIKKNTVFHVTDGYKYKIHFYSSPTTSAYTSDTGFLVTDYTVTADAYVLFDIAKIDGSTVSPSAGSTVISVSVGSNKALDAVNDAFSISYVPSLEWEIGTFNASGQPSANNARCRTSDFVEVSEFSEITLNPSSTKLEVLYYASDRSYMNYVGWVTSDLTVPIISGCKYVKFAGGKTNDVTLTASDINTIASQVTVNVVDTVDLKELSETIDALKASLFTVMTYNVQMFTGLNANETMQEIIIEKYKPDIIGLQEFREVINSDPDRSIYQNIFSEYPNHYRYTGIPNSVGIVSKNKLFETVGAKFTFQAADDPDATGYKEDRGYIKTYIYQDGKKICWLNTHLDLNASTRYVQLGELRNIMATEEYCILTGDMNTANMTDFSSAEWINSIKPFVDAGYNVTNNSAEFGINWTFSGSTDGLSARQAIDTVITTPNIQCAGIIFDKTKLDYTDGTNLIDHIPVIVRFILT